jgi:transposase
MLAIHPNARTTPAVRAEIARSSERAGVPAARYGVSAETVRKWRRRGPGDCRDRSSRPRRLPWKASEEERAVVCALRRATGFPLDNLTFVVRHFLPHLGRDNVYRILKAEGLSRRPAPITPERAAARFKEYELGFAHLDVKHLPKLRTAMASGASASCSWPSIGARAPSTSRSRTTRPRRAPGPSCGRRSRPSPSASPAS